jgi:hypothetical protein
MVVENAFGRLKGRWRVLLKASDVGVQKIVDIVSTCCALHNICEDNKDVFRREWLEEGDEANVRFPQPDNVDVGEVFADGDEKRRLLAESLFSNDNFFKLIFSPQNNNGFISCF